MSTSPDDVRKAAMQDVVEQCKKVVHIHAKLLRGESCTDVEAMIVRRLIRTLVAEWV